MSCCTYVFTAVLTSLALTGCPSNRNLDVKPEDLATSGDISLYRRLELPLVAAPELINPNFADGMTGWKCGSGYSSAPAQGFNQTAALIHERANPEDYALAIQCISLKPGMPYRFSAMIKCEEVRGGDERGATIGMQFYKNGKYLGGTWPSGVNATTDWRLVEGTATAPSDADSCEFVLYMRRGLTGKAWFTKATIEAVNRPAEAHLLRPAQERFLTNDGNFILRWDLPGDFGKGLSAKKLQTCVGLRSGDRVVKVERFACMDLVTKGDLGSLPTGELTLRATLLDPESKTILHEAEFPVACLNPSEIPEKAVRVDAKGRTFIAGKPFLPVGLVFGGVSREEVKTIAGSPFNCIMPYNSLNLAFEDNSNQVVERIREVLDALAAANIKVIFSIKDIYENAVWAGGRIDCPKGWNGVKGEKEILASVVENFRNHPALLAWYTCDEMSASYALRLLERRRLLRQLDPWHPTWAVYCDPNELSRMTSTSDVLGIDPYPIGKLDSRSMGIVDRFATKARETLAGDGGGVPLWGMAQAQNVGLYEIVNGRRWDRAEDRAALLVKYRAPTEEEMRAMSLLLAIQGARGFVYYSYYDQLKPAVLPDFPRRWKELCNVGGLMRELQPFLYSDEKAPAITVKTDQGTVHAATYKTSEGKVKVLITGTGPGESEAEISLTGCDNLHSRYGKCEALGGGKYRFKGTDICSDVLESF